ncbi:hypothetical protein PSA5_14100 [Pseudomonas syringae pv. actinidiae]|nr:hypothetical protein PSA5_14100 [Pseudomonas syringae pv. actinidiae]
MHHKGWSVYRVQESDASLVRELPGTGSKTSRLGVPDTTEATGLGAASQPIAAVVTF